MTCTTKGRTDRYRQVGQASGRSITTTSAHLSSLRRERPLARGLEKYGRVSLNEPASEYDEMTVGSCLDLALMSAGARDRAGAGRRERSGAIN